jgi:PAS domain S-box-containing protein
VRVARARRTAARRGERARRGRGRPRGGGAAIEALLAPLTDAVLVVDAHDRLRLANPAAAALFGLGADDAGGAVVPLVRSADFIELMRPRAGAGEAKATILLNRRRWPTCGSRRPARARTSEASARTRPIFVLADVTALKRLQAMEREFVTNVSHDLRTPVTILRGYAETLDDDHATMSAEDRTRFIRRRSSARWAGCRDSSKVCSPSPASRRRRGSNREPGALHRRRREVCEEYRPGPGRPASSLALDLRADEAAATDPVQSRRLLQNLIDNALGPRGRG